jgi:hypothetical protein
MNLIANLKMKRTSLNRLVAGFAAGLALLASVTANADERFFTYTQDADVIPKGAWEFEQWITLRSGKAGKEYSRWIIREEIEHGFCDNFSGAMYLNFKNTFEDDGITQENEFEFDGISLEGKYRILNPNTAPIGLALYVEPTFNGHEFEMEEKIIVSKNFGDKWIAAANVIAEHEWEWDRSGTAEESVLEFTAGVSYRVTPNWAVGIEARNHRVFDGALFGSQMADAYFVGPAVHYGTSRWWCTLTVLPQVHGSPDVSGGLEIDEHTRIEVRFIAGINF